MVSIAPSAQKVRFHVEHALDCFETLGEDPEVCSAKVRSMISPNLEVIWEMSVETDGNSADA